MPNDPTPPPDPARVRAKGAPPVRESVAPNDPLPTPPESDVEAAKAKATPAGTESLRTMMPTGEVGVRHPPELETSSLTGNSSKAEDTSRAAGYVADLDRESAPPPGPPLKREATDVVGPEGDAPPPVAPTPTPTQTKPTPPNRPAPGRRAPESPPGKPRGGA